MKRINVLEISESEQSKLIPITHFSDKLPYRTALSRCSKHISLLAERYKAIGAKTSFKRYGQCWDYFPSDLTEENLSQIIFELNRLFNSHRGKVSLTIKSMNCEVYYENITKTQIKNMLHCAYALKQDLLILTEKNK